MPNNRQQFTLQINADTSQAKKQVNDLINSLQKITKMNLESPVKDTQLNQASQAAIELQKHLQAAFNVDTGKLNLNTFNNSLAQSNSSIKQLSDSLLQAGITGKEAFMSLASTITNAEVPIKQMNKTLQNWGITLKNTLKWELSSSLVHGLESAFSNAIGYAKNLNSSLNDIRIVTGQTIDDMARFTKEANLAAKALSTSTKSYADASLIYYQQGDSPEEAARKAAITIKAANASFGSSAAEMSEYLTAVWNSYQVGADELERYVDIMAALGAKTATSLEEIATSMQKVAATGNTVGVSMEQVSSIIATVSSVTRESAESIGTSYKTIFARMGDLKLGGEDEEGIKLGQVSSALDSIGIQILDANGDLREMGDIITDLGNKWQTMDNATKTAVAQVVAGKRQYTQLMALFENWDMYNANMNVANNANGELNRMADIYAQSWEAASARVQASLEGIYNDILNPESMIAGLNVLKEFIQGLNGLINGFGNLTGIIATFGGKLAQSFSADIAQGLVSTYENIKNAITGAKNEQEQFFINQANAREQLLSFIDYDDFDSSDKYQLEAMIAVSEANDKLLLQSQNLSQAQQQQIKSVIAAYQQEVAAISEVQAARDKVMKKQEEDQKKLVNSILERTAMEKDSDLGKKGSLEYKNAIKQADKDILEPLRGMEEFNKSLEEVGLLVEDISFTKIIDQVQLLTTESANLETIIEKFKEKTGGQGLEKLFATDETNEERLKNLITYLEKIESIAERTGISPNYNDSQMQTRNEAVNKVSSGEKVSDDEIKAMAEIVNQGLTAMQTVFNQKTSAIRELIEKIIPDGAKEDFEELFQRWEKDGTTGIAELDDFFNDAKQRLNKTIEGIFSQSTQTISEFVRATSGLSAITGIVNSVSSAFDTLANSNASASQKIGAVIGILVSSLQNLLTIQKAVEAVTKLSTGAKLGKAAADTIAAGAAKAHATATVTDNAATEINTLKTNANTASKIANKVAGLGIAAAAIAAVAAIATLTAKIIELNKENERAAKIAEGQRFEERLEQHKEEAELIDEMTKKYKELNDKKDEVTDSEYNTGIADIAKNLGIENAAVLELAGSYQVLANKVKESLEQRQQSIYQNAQMDLKSMNSTKLGSMWISAGQGTIFDDDDMYAQYNELRIYDFFNRLWNTNSKVGDAGLKEDDLWKELNNKNTQWAKDLYKKYGVSNDGKAWELMAAMLGVSQVTWGTGGDQSLAIGNNKEDILDTYYALQQLQEIAKGTTQEAVVASSLLATQQVKDLITMVESLAMPIVEANQRVWEHEGQNYLDNNELVQQINEDNFQKTRTTLIKNLLDQWQMTDTSNPLYQFAYDTAANLIDETILGINDGLVSSVVNAQLADSSKSSIEKYLEQRFTDKDELAFWKDIIDTIIESGGSFDGLNFNDLNFSNGQKGLQDSIVLLSEANKNRNIISNVKTGLSTYSSGEYDTNSIYGMFMPALELLNDGSAELLANFDTMSGSERARALGEAAAHLEENLSTVYDKAQDSMDDANEMISERAKEFNDRANEFLSSIGIKDKNVDLDEYIARAERYQEIIANSRDEIWKEENLFGDNQIQDTLSDFSNILGYTNADIDELFRKTKADLAKNLTKMGRTDLSSQVSSYGSIDDIFNSSDETIRAIGISLIKSKLKEWFNDELKGGFLTNRNFDKYGIDNIEEAKDLRTQIASLTTYELNEEDKFDEETARDNAKTRLAATAELKLDIDSMSLEELQAVSSWLLKDGENFSKIFNLSDLEIAQRKLEKMRKEFELSGFEPGSDEAAFWESIIKQQEEVVDNLNIEEVSKQNEIALEKLQNRWNEIATAANSASQTINSVLNNIASWSSLTNQQLLELKNTFETLGLSKEYNNFINEMNSATTDEDRIKAAAKAQAIITMTQNDALREQRDLLRNSEFVNGPEEPMSWNNRAIKRYDRDYLTLAKKYVSGEYKNDTSISPEAKAQIESYIQEAKKELDYAEIEFSNLSDDQIKEIYQKALEYVGQDTLKFNASIELNEAGLMDSWHTALSSILSAEQMAAQETYNLWENTFRAIQTAREGLANGKSIIQALRGNPEELALIIKQLNQMNEGRGSLYSLDEIRQMIYDPTQNVDWQDFDINNYANQSLAKYAMDEGQIDTDIEKFKERLKTDINDNYESFIRGLETDDLEKLGVETANEAIEKFKNSKDNLINLLMPDDDAFSTFIAELQAKLLSVEYTKNNSEINKDLAEIETQYASRTVSVEQGAAQRSSVQNAIYAISRDEELSPEDQATLQDLFPNRDIASLTFNELSEELTRLSQEDTQYLKDIRDEYQDYLDGFTEEINEFGEKTGNKVNAEGKILTAEKEQELQALIDSYSQQLAVSQITQEDYSAIANLQTLMDGLAESVGMTSEDFAALAQQLYEVNGGTEDLATLIDGTGEQYYNLAKRVAEISNAWKDLKSSQSDAIAIIKSGNKANVQYAGSLRGIAKDIEKIFGSSLKNINGFIEDNIDAIEAMANGSDDAAEQVEAAFLRVQLAQEGIDYDQEINIDVDADGVADGLTTIGAMLSAFGDEYANEPVGFTATLDDTPALAGLTNLVNMGYMTADQMNEAFRTIGWEPEINEMEVTVDNVDQTNSTATVVDSNGKRYTVKATQNMQTGQTIKIPVIGSAKKTGGGAKGMGTNKSSSGGGGGGGGEPKTLDKKQPEDEMDRYHVVKKQIDRLNEAMTKNDKIKDRLYGKGRLQYLEKEIALTEQEIELQKEYLAQAKGWLEIDRQRVESIGAEFDAEGNISNYEKVMQGLMSEYNEFIEAYNAMTAEQQKNMDKEKEQWDKWYEERVKWIKDYEESVQLIYEKQNDIIEGHNKISSLKLETIQYKVEIHMDITDMENDFLDYLNSKYEEVVANQDKVMENLIKKTQNAEGNLKILGQARNELDAAYASGELNQEDYVNGLKEVNEQILENLQSIEDLRKEIKELYGDTLDMATKQLERQRKKIDAAADAMGSYINIMRLMGHEVDYKMLGEFYEYQLDYSLKSIDAQKKYLDILKQEEQYYLERMNSVEGLSEVEREQYEDLEETIQEVQSQFLSQVENAAQLIQEKFQNAINQTMKIFEESVVGAGNSINWMSEQYGRYMKTLDRYAAGHEEVYKISKLNRTIESELAKSRTSAYKKELKEFQDLIKAKSENNELSEYQLEHMELELELILKRQQLLDAQNAKDTVRLTRDSAGNYIYQYTADQGKLMEAQQNIEDTLYQMAQLEYQTVHELEQSLIQLQQEAQQAITDILNDTSLTDEQKKERIAEIMEWYKEQQKYYSSQLDIVLTDQQNTYNAHLEHYKDDSAAYNDIIQKNFNDTSIGLSGILTDALRDSDIFEKRYAELWYGLTGEMSKCLEQVSEDEQAYLDQYKSVFGEYQGILGEWEDNLASLENTSGITYDSIKDHVEAQNKVVKDAQNETDKLADILENELLPSVHKLTDKWNDHLDSLLAVIDEYEKLYEAIMDVIAAEAERDAQKQKDEDVIRDTQAKAPDSGSVNTDTTAKPSENTNSGNSSGSGGNGGKTGSTSSSASKIGIINVYYKTVSGKTIDSTRKEYSNTTTVYANVFQKSIEGYKYSYSSAERVTVNPGETKSLTLYYTTDYQGTLKSAGCFVAGTKIIMADNSVKNIEDIKIGEYVIAYNEIDNKFESKKVINAYAHHDTPRVLEITFSNGVKLGITPGHPFLTPVGWKSRDIDNSLWEHGVEAKWLEIGDEIISYNNNVFITNIIELDIPEHYDTYNLTVETCHTYTVEGLVVHNAKTTDVNMNGAYQAYASGGLNTVTGPAWLDGTKANPELVLNPSDTRNILTATSVIRSIDKNTLDRMDSFINQSTQNMMMSLGSISASYSASAGADRLEQEVHITAEFPNVTNSSEIQDAFDNLINRATQFITTKR